VGLVQLGVWDSVLAGWDSDKWVSGVLVSDNGTMGKVTLTG
jgi:hypothetical protein